MTKRKPLPSQEYLRECFEYNPDTGELLWKKRPLAHFKSERYWRALNSRCAGKIAGCISDDRAYVTIQGRLYLLHRVIWKLLHNEEPKEIDHKDCASLNNKIKNLRRATRNENARNRSRQNNNTSGVVGVHYHKPSKRWRATMKINGEMRHLGSFTNFDEAVGVRREAEKKHYGEFRKLNR